MAVEKLSNITEELENRFLTYALSTIVSRSLPDVRDGLKPIHRRILYAMNGIGVSSDTKHVKSAKIIGEVLGKYHPHGDASTYESMARMAQDFSMRYPLVDGKGNFGSMDGDPPAAYRYTEGRLTPITAFLLADLKKETIDFKQTYDNTAKEPSVLPSRVPNLLINGSSGIAVGMACSFPSHNLSEVLSAMMALIDDPDLSVSKVMKYIKGPDFPTGAIILNSKAELAKAYEQGTGAIKLRSEWTLEDLPRGKSQIIVTSIPYSVNKSRLMEKIAEVIINKKLPSLIDVRDESDEKVRMVLEVKSGGDPEKIMTYLFKHTELESNFPLNFTCLKPNGEPDRLSLLEICKHFLDFRKDVVTRRLTYDLKIIEKRLHILAAFAAIFKGLDKALKLIRSSKSKKEAGDKIENEFNLDNEQSNAILEIPLYRLVSLEIDKILQEQKEKLKEQKALKAILGSQKKIWNEVKTEFEEIKNKFGDKRLSKIKTIESTEYNAEDFIEHEDVSIVVSQNGWLRKLKTLTDPDSLKFKEGDSLHSITYMNTRDLIAFFTSRGMVYVQKAFSLEYTRGGGFGEPVQSLLKFKDGERIVRVMHIDSPTSESTSIKKDTKDQKTFAFEGSSKGSAKKINEFMAVSDAGYGFRFSIDNLSETTRSGKKVMTLKDSALMIGIAPVTHPHILLASEKGKALVIETKQVPQLTGQGMGVKLIKLTDCKLAGFKFVGLKEKFTMELEGGKTQEESVKNVPIYNRGGQGVFISKRKQITNIL
jgi:DNA gyrase subunit A